MPVDEDRGLDSPISAHFGDAPYFAVLELSEGSHKVSAVRNPAREGPGSCKWDLVSELKPDAVAVRAIGRRAYEMLTSSGVKIYIAVGNALRDVLDALKRGTLREFPPRAVHEPMHWRRAAGRSSASLPPALHMCSCGHRCRAVST